MQRRPIINTRDEPHANPKFYRRFHVILGDANMSPFATRLKVGSTALALEALVLDPKRCFPKLADPLAALFHISRDPEFRWEVKIEGNKAATGLEIQRAYLDAVKELCDLSSPERAELVSDWEAVLDNLAVDYRRCRDRLDWVAKLALVREFQAAQNLADDDPWLRSFDLEYHRLDFAEGLYYGLEQSGAMRGVPHEAAVRDAIKHPPFSRAYIRGKCIQKFATFVTSAQWDHITLQGTDGPIRISLLDLFAPDEIVRYAKTINAARSPDDLRTIATAAPN
jgi:proteasome accessory factor A